MKTTSTKIDEILESQYGCGIVSAPVEAIEWAAAKIADTKTAKSEVKRANRLREKYGRMPLYLPYGHRLF